MAKIKLTEKEKQEKHQREALQHVCNKLMSGFSFKTINIWHDVYIASGLDAETIASHYTNSSAAVTFPELKKYCERLKAKLEDAIRTRNTAPVVAAVEQKVEPITEPQLTNKLDEDYNLVPSPNEKAYLYWFQKKACAELLLGFGIT